MKNTKPGIRRRAASIRAAVMRGAEKTQFSSFGKGKNQVKSEVFKSNGFTTKIQPQIAEQPYG